MDETSMKKLNAEPEMKEIVMKHIGYRFKGVSCIIDWYDDTGVIKMKPFDVMLEDITEEKSLEDIVKENLNDNGFGCQAIRGAYLVKYNIYAYDGNEIAIFADDDIYVNADENIPLTLEECDFIFENAMYHC